MESNIKIDLAEFLELFEEVFDKDWKYSKEMMGIQEETEQQRRNAKDLGLEIIYNISEDGTFLRPNVDDETENWGNRGALLRSYRKLKQELKST